MMDHFITTGGITYRVPSGGGETDADAMIEHLTQYCSTEQNPAGPVVFLSRQQIASRTGKAVLPTDFPEPDAVVGDPNRDGAFTRGWLESTVQSYATAHADTPDEAPASAGHPVPEGAKAPELEEGWEKDSQQWTDVAATAADAQIVIATSKGVLEPRGRVITRPIMGGKDLGRFLRWHWPAKTRDVLPQVWITAEALEAIEFPLDVESDEQIVELVEKHFLCKVSRHQAGWFVCAFGTGAELVKAHVVLVPCLMLDPSDSRPDDMGLARIEFDETELPDDEIEAAHTLARRMAWLAQLANGVLPQPRWAAVGIKLMDAIRARGRKLDPPLQPCPLPEEVAAGLVLEPPLTIWRNPPHRAKTGMKDVTVDQVRAYLASSGQVWLGYGTPGYFARPNTQVFNEDKPPFGIWHVNLPAAKDLDGLSKRLALPQEHMSWDDPTSLWITTRGVQHLVMPVENGGAGMAPAELDIDGAYLWPKQSKLLKVFTETLRAVDTAAAESGHVDHIAQGAMVKAIYTSYFGKMEAEKLVHVQRLHQQPAFTATIRADVRIRALKYAARIAADHDLYPISVNADAWVYRIPVDQEPEFLEEHNNFNGRYRIKEIEIL